MSFVCLSSFGVRDWHSQHRYDEEHDIVKGVLLDLSSCQPILIRSAIKLSSDDPTLIIGLTRIITFRLRPGLLMPKSQKLLYIILLESGVAHSDLAPFRTNSLGLHSTYIQSLVRDGQLLVVFSTDHSP
jgi:hypothetical protein